MTRVRWSAPANADFAGIIEGIKAGNPQAAARVGRRSVDAIEALAAHPYLGKPGCVPDTRESRGFYGSPLDGAGALAGTRTFILTSRQNDREPQT